MELKRTKQCKHCPWRKDACVDDILGYSPELHPKLEETIAQPMDWSGLYGNQLKIMACHESPVGDETACIGWLVNQLGPGNNILLRLAMRSCPERGEIETVGEQHETFEDTLPTI
jgi:Family of unknown function (DUF6283)